MLASLVPIRQGVSMQVDAGRKPAMAGRLQGSRAGSSRLQRMSLAVPRPCGPDDGREIRMRGAEFQCLARRGGVGDQIGGSPARRGFTRWGTARPVSREEAGPTTPHWPGAHASASWSYGAALAVTLQLRCADVATISGISNRHVASRIGATRTLPPSLRRAERSATIPAARQRLQRIAKQMIDEKNFDHGDIRRSP